MRVSCCDSVPGTDFRGGKLPAAESYRTVVVGGGQAGLATAYYLSRGGDDFVILEAGSRVGETWRRRWDSLRLFTPSKYNSLPGMPFPADDFYFPTKDETADYLQAYARRFDFPLRLNSHVESLTRSDGRFALVAGEKTYLADNVVVATGGYQVPAVPPFAHALGPRIAQLHSSAYRNPDQIPDGNILVVGAGNSGAEISVELALAGRNVSLSGRDVRRIPANELGKLLGGRPYWAFVSRVLSINTPIGRKVREKALHEGTPLIRLSARDILDAGVVRRPRVCVVLDGKPVLADGKALDVSAIVWATGYRPDYSWIQIPIFDKRGYPFHMRGVVPRVPGLYFVGLHFQTALSSALIGGVGRDARYVTDCLEARAAIEERPAPQAA